MSSFVFGSKPTGSALMKSRNSNGNGEKKRIYARSQPHIITAMTNGGPSPINGGGYQTNRYGPVYDRLEEGSVVEDWIPRDLPGLDKMMRMIYTRDAIAGPTVDLWSNMPWSSAELLGIDDPTIKKFYEDFLSCFDPVIFGPEISRDTLVTGRFIASLIYDESKGYWTDIVPHDGSFCIITPIPVRGFDPKIDVQLSPGMRQFLMSNDPRDVYARNSLPKSLLEKLQRGGKIELDPLATLFIARKTSVIDYVGTSFYTRILPMWALEKALINATVTAARRRCGNILHVQVGIDDRWEPTLPEIEDIAGMFIQADEDPVGAVVATRTGVNASEIRQGGSMWKMSDEWQFLSESKMRALGINDSFLSGEASYNTLEQTMSVFLEQIRNFREWMTRQTYYKMFEILARTHGFVKRTKAELAHRIRINDYSKDPKSDKDKILKNQIGEELEVNMDNYKGINRKNPSQDKAFEISKEKLIIPTMHYLKSLKPEADKDYLEVLNTMEEKGIPVTIKKWAAAGGYDLKEIMDSLDEDIKLRKKISKWGAEKAKYSTGDDGGMGGGMDMGGGGMDMGGMEGEDEAAPEENQEATDTMDDAVDDSLDSNENQEQKEPESEEKSEEKASDSMDDIIDDVLTETKDSDKKPDSDKEKSSEESKEEETEKKPEEEKEEPKEEKLEETKVEDIKEEKPDSDKEKSSDKKPEEKPESEETPESEEEEEETEEDKKKKKKKKKKADKDEEKDALDSVIDKALSSKSTKSVSFVDLPIWHNNKFLMLSVDDLNKVTSLIRKEPKILRDKDLFLSKVNEVLKGNTAKVELINYIFMRMGLLVNLPISSRINAAIVQWLGKILSNNKKTLLKELVLLNRIQNSTLDNPVMKDSIDKRIEDIRKSIKNRVNIENIPNNSPNLLTGMVF